MKITAFVATLALALAPVSALGDETGTTPVEPAPAGSPQAGGVAAAPLLSGFGISSAGLVAVSGLVIVTGVVVGLAVAEDAQTTTSTTTSTSSTSSTN